MGLEYYLYLDLQSEFANKNCLVTRAINVRHYRSVACHVVDLGSISWLEGLVHKVAIHAVYLASSQSTNVNARVVCTGTSYACPAVLFYSRSYTHALLALKVVLFLQPV